MKRPVYLFYNVTLNILHVSVCHGPSSGNQTKDYGIKPNQSLFCTDDEV